MATRKVLRVIVGVCAVLVCTLGWVMPGAAETLNFKFYTWVIKSESVPVGDLEGHTAGLVVRGGFTVFDTGEVATTTSVATTDYVKGAGPWMQYTTIKFPDGATMIIKSQGTMGAGASAFTSEILTGTGRFAGVKGTQSAKATFLPVEPGEAGTRGYGEGTITYTLPPK